MNGFPLHPYDACVLVILVAMTIFGAWKGLAWQIASLASMVVSGLVSVHNCDELAPYCSSEEPWNRFLAMLVLFVGTSLVIWLGFRLLAGVINGLRLGPFDRQLGAIFGLAKGVVLVLVGTFFAVTLSAPARNAIHSAQSPSYISKALRGATPYLPERVRVVMDDYIAILQKNLDEPAGGGVSDLAAPNMAVSPAAQPPAPAPAPAPVSTPVSAPPAQGVLRLPPPPAAPQDSVPANAWDLIGQGQGQGSQSPRR